MYFYIYLAVLLVSLGVASGSMYGLGENDHDKNSSAYIFASIFFNISLITALVSVVLIVKDSQAHEFCTVNKLFKPKKPNATVESIAKAIIEPPALVKASSKPPAYTTV